MNGSRVSPSTLREEKVREIQKKINALFPPKGKEVASVTNPEHLHAEIMDLVQRTNLSLGSFTVKVMGSSQPLTKELLDWAVKQQHISGAKLAAQDIIQRKGTRSNQKQNQDQLDFRILTRHLATIGNGATYETYGLTTSETVIFSLSLLAPEYGWLWNQEEPVHKNEKFLEQEKIELQRRRRELLNSERGISLLRVVSAIHKKETISPTDLARVLTTTAPPLRLSLS